MLKLKYKNHGTFFTDFEVHCDDAGTLQFTKDIEERSHIVPNREEQDKLIDFLLKEQLLLGK